MLDPSAPLEIFEEIDSTIVEARRRAERGELGPVWMIARRQTAGRGRRGRSWASFDGNLMATYLGVAHAPPAEIALLGFAAGVAIAEAFDEILGPGRATLKWPNDLFLDGAKAAGLMLDSGALDKPGAYWLALAFGVNIVGSPDGIDQETAALRDALPPDAVAPTPEALLALIRPRLEAHAARLPRDGFEPLRRAWLTRAHGLGKSARVLIGAESVEGRIVGLSPRGELELDTGAGVRLVAAGDILLSPAAA